MANNKNAAIRYKALDECFSNPYRMFMIDDLIEYCSTVLSDYYAKETTVSRRQIYDDIKFMESNAGYDAPIERHKDGRSVYYRYSDINFSILKKTLNSSDIKNLQHALETLFRVKNKPGFDWVESLLTKINSSLTLLSGQKQIISFEENEYLKGLEFLGPLYNFILNEQCLEIIYKSFASTDQVSYIISPFFLKQYNNRWFLFGHNHELEKIQNLALDRIIGLTPLQTKYESCFIDFDEYFSDIIGVTNNINQQPVQIIIELSQNILPYVKSKPLHGSQKLKSNILELNVKINYELISLILSYGENMKVLSPNNLVHIIKQKVKSLNSFY